MKFNTFSFFSVQELLALLQIRPGDRRMTASKEACPIQRARSKCPIQRDPLRSTCMPDPSAPILRLDPLTLTNVLRDLHLKELMCTMPTCSNLHSTGITVMNAEIDLEDKLRMQAMISECNDEGLQAVASFLRRYADYQTLPSETTHAVRALLPQASRWWFARSALDKLIELLASSGERSESESPGEEVELAHLSPHKMFEIVDFIHMRHEVCLRCEFWVRGHAKFCDQCGERLPPLRSAGPPLVELRLGLLPPRKQRQLFEKLLEMVDAGEENDSTTHATMPNNVAIGPSSS